MPNVVFIFVTKNMKEEGVFFRRVEPEVEPEIVVLRGLPRSKLVISNRKFHNLVDSFIENTRLDLIFAQSKISGNPSACQAKFVL